MKTEKIEIEVEGQQQFTAAKLRGFLLTYSASYESILFTVEGLDYYLLPQYQTDEAEHNLVKQAVKCWLAGYKTHDSW